MTCRKFEFRDSRVGQRAIQVFDPHRQRLLRDHHRKERNNQNEVFLQFLFTCLLSTFREYAKSSPQFLNKNCKAIIMKLGLQSNQLLFVEL
jgi:hypothetical protein